MDEIGDEVIIWEPGNVEYLACAMIFMHFFRLIYEAGWLEKNSHRTQSLRRLCWDMFVFWGLLGIGVGFTVFHWRSTGSHAFFDLESDEPDAEILKLSALSCFIYAEVRSHLCRCRIHEEMQRQVDIDQLNSETSDSQ